MIMVLIRLQHEKGRRKGRKKLEDEDRKEMVVR
jgi:hypothetical protein